MRGGSPLMPGGMWSATIDPSLRSVHCTALSCPGPGPVGPGSALREVAVRHLGIHAQRERLPEHLRTCACGQRNCRWHGRHRGCDGNVVLVLFQHRGGRSWHLADMCRDCARAVPGSAQVSLPTHSAPEPSPPKEGSTRRRGGGEACSAEVRCMAVRAALGYTAALLSESIHVEARLLAVLCVLRLRADGRAPLPAGWLRSLRLETRERAVGELLATRGLHLVLSQSGGPALLVPELALTGPRPRAGHRAQSLLTAPQLRRLSPGVRLAALTVAAWCEPGERFCRLDPDSAARGCGLTPDGLLDALTALHASGWLQCWTQEPSGLLRCLPHQPYPL